MERLKYQIHHIVSIYIKKINYIIENRQWGCLYIIVTQLPRDGADNDKCYFLKIFLWDILYLDIKETDSILYPSTYL